MGPLKTMGRLNTMGSMNMPRRLAAAVLVAGLSACAVGPNFKRPAPPADSGYGSAPIAGRHRVSPGHGRRRAALCGGHGHPERVVDAVQIAAAQSPGGASAAGQRGRRRRASGAAAGARAVQGTADQLFSGRAGELHGHSRQERAGYHCQPNEPPANESLLQSLYGAGDGELSTRCIRGHAARGRGGKGAGRIQPLRARGHLLDVEQQCRGHCG